MIPYSGDEIRAKAAQKGYGVKEIRFFEGLAKDFSDLHFRMGARFAFKPPRTIILGPSEPFSRLLALHEVSHAILKHHSFRMDVERLKMEREAWDMARKLADGYNVWADEELIQHDLDTYRDWLHQKSRCPRCGLTRFQTADSSYSCPQCDNY